MERLIKATLAGMAAVIAVTGFVFGTAPVATSTGAAPSDEVAIKRDEDDVEDALARLDDDDDDDDDDWTSGGELAAANAAAANGDMSRSRDRSRDVTSIDRSNSLDRSRDRTGDGVGVLDRSYSRDRSRDRTGDHDSRDSSRSRDVSRDNTSVSNSNSNSFA